MRLYELTLDAESDLEEISRYTIKQWGEEQAKVYLDKISQCFKDIAKDKAVSRPFSGKYSDAKVVHCEHHYIFYLASEGKNPVIFAVLHERMDLLARLQSRLR